MWISKEELQKLVEKRARGLFVSERIEAINHQTELLKKELRCLQVENNLLTTKLNDYIYGYNDLKKQNNGLTAKNNALNMWNENSETIITKLRNELDNSKKEADELKKELDRCYRIHDLFNSMPDKFKELELLKEEHEQLKERNKDLEEFSAANYKLKVIYENKLNELLKGAKPLYADWFVDKKMKENKQLKEENASLKQSVEKGFDSINTSLLEKATQLDSENKLLNHELSCLKDQLNSLTNKELKRDKYGVISKCEDDKIQDICVNCVYYDKEYESCSIEMTRHCTSNNRNFEYYSSK